MATLTAPRSLTAEDVYRRFGPIPLDRVRLRPYPATIEDVIRIHAREDRACELVDGILLEKPMGYRESVIAGFLIQIIRNYNDGVNLGEVAGEHGMMELAPDLVRIPDVSFVRWTQFPGGVVPTEPIPSIFPDLAVEVLSLSNTAREMEEKLRDYFEAGTQLVWLVDPLAGIVEVCESADRAAARVLRDGDSLDGGAVLPGFAVPVRHVLAGSAR